MRTRSGSGRCVEAVTRLSAPSARPLLCVLLFTRPGLVFHSHNVGAWQQSFPPVATFSQQVPQAVAGGGTTCRVRFLTRQPKISGDIVTVWLSLTRLQLKLVQRHCALHTHGEVERGVLKATRCPHKHWNDGCRRHLRIEKVKTLLTLN